MLLMWGHQACTSPVVRVTQLGLEAGTCRCQVSFIRFKWATAGLCIGQQHC